MTQDELTNWQHKNDVNASFCTDCNKSIWYDNTVCGIRSRRKNKGNAFYKGTSYLTFKELGDVVYHIKKCANCLTNAHSSYKDKNKSKIFNTLNKYVSYAFDIPQYIIDKHNKKRVPTLDNMIKKYGHDIGNLKWEEYKRKQSITNTLEYKKEKYGWGNDQFNEYNKSRAVTLENLINKYGEINGNKKWNSYLEKQKVTKSKQCVIEKYGVNYWIDLCKSKANTYDNFIKRHGIDKGPGLFESYISKLNSNLLYSSKIATGFFDNLVKSYPKTFSNLTVYYAGNDLGEYGKYCKSNSKYYFVDFYIKELNLAIEFNGNYFHANPEFYHDDFIFWHTDLTASEIRQLDESKTRHLYNDHNIKSIVVWESDYDRNTSETILKIHDIIKNEVNAKL
jgi:hypothetical protein